jgi:hypothetical protein
MIRVIDVEFDGTSVKAIIGRTEIPLLASSYGDNLQPEKVRQMGSQLIDAVTLGTYETDEGKVKMRSSVFRGIFLPLADRYGFGNRVLPVVFSFEHPDIGSDSDELLCRFTKIAAAQEASNKGLEVELGLTVTQIWWGDARKTINTFDPSIPLGTPAL